MNDTALHWTTAPPCPDTIAEIAASTEPGTHSALERVAAWERAIAWMQAQQAAELAELAALVAEAETSPPPGWTVADSVGSTIAEIGLILHVTTNTAARRAHHARDLIERFPATCSLLHSGDLTAVKARIMVEECADLSEADAARVEAAVLPCAPGQTPGRLREAIRRAIARVDADAAARRRARRTRERKVVLYPERDGMASMVATLPAAEAVGVYAGLAAFVLGEVVDVDRQGGHERLVAQPRLQSPAHTDDHRADHAVARPRPEESTRSDTATYR